MFNNFVFIVINQFKIVVYHVAILGGKAGSRFSRIQL